MRTIRDGRNQGRTMVVDRLRRSGGLAAAGGELTRSEGCGRDPMGAAPSVRLGSGAHLLEIVLRAVLLPVLLCGVSAAAGDHGVTARFVPDEVRPGEVFELRVEMGRPEFGSFQLQVPAHGSLHRVAVETEPVQWQGGSYRQRESWMLQADRSGEIVITNASVVITTGPEEATVALPPLRVVVLPWGGEDEDSAPAGFPTRTADAQPDRSMAWLLPISAVLCLLGWWLWFVRTGPDPPQRDAGGAMADALVDLDGGQLRSVVLERLLCEKGTGWSGELREAVEEAVYAGRGDAGELAAMLRKEVGA